MFFKKLLKRNDHFGHTTKFHFGSWKKEEKTLNKNKNQVSIKVGDLGNSKEIKEYSNAFVGTQFYVSPEVIKNEAYTAKIDVW
jgi:serine/threonine protein kinase